ncbi:hypothetical protein ACFVJS_03730 [Nocardioides sp. NPDC057772]|uniref:hypothetical protein n=1 Tax=Nocardioides sp. NPDC057772 TaxID=3346245 RepID=UPI00366F4619
MATLIPIGAITGGGTGGPVSAGDITDATAVGVALVTATDALAARNAIGATDLAVGTGPDDAKAGDWVPDVAEVEGLAAALGEKVDTTAAVLKTQIFAGLDLSTDRTAEEVTAALADATTAAAGTVELATTAETTAGTDATRAVTPAGVAASVAAAAEQLQPILSGAPVGRFRGFLTANPPLVDLVEGDWWFLIEA